MESQPEIRPAGILARLRANPEWPVVRDIAVPVVAQRIVMIGFGWLAVALFASQTLNDGLLGIWNHWDGPHFLEVAATGYGPPTDPARIVLFPLYPLAIKIGSFLLPPLGAAMLISLVATIAAAVGLYRLVALDAPKRMARLSVVAMIAFPTAYAFVGPYSEALFLALTVWAFVAVRRDDVRLAGILGMLAAMTRIQGIFLLPALGLEYLMVRHHLNLRDFIPHRTETGGFRVAALGRDYLTSPRKLDSGVAWILFVGVGFIVYLAINQIYFGSPLNFVAAQDKWFHVQNEMPWVALPKLFNAFVTGAPNEGWVTVYLAPVVAFVLLACVTAWTVVSKHSRPSYAVYTAISLVTFASLSWPISVPRYIIGVFPIFIALGSAYRSALGQVVLMASVMLMSVLTVLFVIGHWAF
jgi:hypothetical protein